MLHSAVVCTPISASPFLTSFLASSLPFFGLLLCLFLHPRRDFLSHRPPSNPPAVFRAYLEETVHCQTTLFFCLSCFINGQGRRCGRWGGLPLVLRAAEPWHEYYDPRPCGSPFTVVNHGCRVESPVLPTKSSAEETGSVGVVYCPGTGE